jgi:DNA-binding NtrC family response regulator
VRELLHVVEAALVLCEGSTVLPEHLPGILRISGPTARPEPVTSAPQPASLEAAERAHIVAALDACDGHRGNTAKVLGISERNLYRKLREYDLLS